MKKLAAILCVIALTVGAFAQGLVIFNNNPTTLISSIEVSSTGPGSPEVLSGHVSYFFGLLISPIAAGPFTFAGAYATNIASPGRLIGGSNLGIPITSWAPGETMFFEVAGWSSSFGATWNDSWINADGSAKAVGTFATGFFGVSSIASGIAGGGPQSLPPQPIFGSTGVPGFSLYTIIPEPGTMAIAGLGAAALLSFRRRK